MNKKVSGGEEEWPRSRDVLPSDRLRTAQTELLACPVKRVHRGVRGTRECRGQGTCELVPP